MKRIESKLGGALGTPKRRNPKHEISNFTPIIDRAIINRAEARAMKDGFSYFRDMIVVLMSLYGRGAVSQKLGRELGLMIRAWRRREDASAARHVVKRNFKLRKDVYERARGRWATESEGLSATAMFAFLLESYADGEIEIALRRGKSD